MNILLIDGYNFLHRARYGFGSIEGDYVIIYNFFRNLKAIIEEFEPDKVYFVLEGHPHHRYNLYPEYKQNRRVGFTPEEDDAYANFKLQRDKALEILKLMPIHIAHNKNYECDDLISSLVNHYKNDKCIVISNDSDFMQLLDLENVSVYSPIKKSYFEKTEYDYISWKSLVGDKSDNIVGIYRVGDVKAKKILKQGLEQWLELNPEHEDIFYRNYELIKFVNIDFKDIDIFKGESNFDEVKEIFKEFKFETMIKDSYWNRFVNTFSELI